MQINTHIENILVPVPLNSGYALPLKQAVHFHKVYGSSVILMHVVPEFSIFHKVLRPERLKKRNRKAMKKLKKLTRTFFNEDIPEYIKLMVVNGELIPSILRTAENYSCDLIIIKKANRIQGRFRFFKKENADKLIANAVCPVMTLMNNYTLDGIRSILIPVDITKRTSGKVAWAVSLAKKFGAKLHIVSVQQLDIRRMDSLSYRKSKQIEKAIQKEGLEVSMTVLKSNDRTMDEVVLEHAAEIKPDMLLIMTHQESVLFDNYLGNFAREILHKSHIPVFSVVPRKETIIGGFINAAASGKN
ncbi:MAG: universal stress protein [Bacteroidales bacterium]|nr:universal stress protein [Bacteroidales bacterium]